VQRLKVKSNSIDSLVCEGRQATIVGTANVSGAGSTTFRIDVDDRGRPGRRDTYRILLGSGYDSGSQFLEGGNITIRSR
jgi:hypothetical protein